MYSRQNTLIIVSIFYHRAHIQIILCFFSFLIFNYEGWFIFFSVQCVMVCVNVQYVEKLKKGVAFLWVVDLYYPLLCFGGMFFFSFLFYTRNVNISFHVYMYDFFFFLNTLSVQTVRVAVRWYGGRLQTSYDSYIILLQTCCVCLFA